MTLTLALIASSWSVSVWFFVVLWWVVRDSNRKAAAARRWVAQMYETTRPGLRCVIEAYL